MSSHTEQHIEIIPAKDVNERYGVTRLMVEVGFLGKLFGSATNAPTNIGGLVLVLLILICAAVIFMPDKMTTMTANDLLAKALPVITLVLGYIFGKGQ